MKTCKEALISRDRVKGEGCGVGIGMGGHRECIRCILGRWSVGRENVSGEAFMEAYWLNCARTIFRRNSSRGRYRLYRLSIAYRSGGEHHIEHCVVGMECPIANQNSLGGRHRIRRYLCAGPMANVTAQCLLTSRRGPLYWTQPR